MNFKIDFEQTKLIVDCLNNRMDELFRDRDYLTKNEKQEFEQCFETKRKLLDMVVDADLGLPSINWFYEQCEISKQLKENWLHGQFNTY